MCNFYGFLLVTADPPRLNGGFGHAWNLVKTRLELGLWPIYSNTRNRKRLHAGMKVSFYVGGHHERAGTVVATAEIKEISSSTNLKQPIDPEEYLTGHADQVLRLSGIEYLQRPIILRNVIELLSFNPSNKLKWGVVLMGGCRALSREDWNILLNSGFGINSD